MAYWKRLLLAWSSAFLVFVLHHVAYSGFGFTWRELGLVLAITGSIALVTGALAAAVVRRQPVAMVLLSQVLMIFVLGAIWNR